MEFSYKQEEMIEIRRAQKDDIDILYELIYEIAKFHNQEQFVLTSREEMLNAGFNENPKFGALIARYNGEVAGYLSFTWNYSIWNGGNYMNMDDLFVLEAFRGKRVGEQLMLHAKGICETNKINSIRWEVESNNSKAISFYSKLGAKMYSKGIFKWKI
ncbi:MAG: GNAT family N-acetyltransferase [Chitinophagales bacterium]|nr:GNAT family N-acetyltransferase [Chitinophagales bacterium]